MRGKLWLLTPFLALGLVACGDDSAGTAEAPPATAPAPADSGQTAPGGSGATGTASSPGGTTGGDTTTTVTAPVTTPGETPPAREGSATQDQTPPKPGG